MNERPNYVAITLLMCVVMLLFQLVGMSLGLFDSDYEINRYATLARDGSPEPDIPAAAEAGTPDVAVLTLPGTENDPTPAVTDGCAYLRLSMRRYEQLTPEALDAGLLVVARPFTAEEIPVLQARCAAGKPILYASLPEMALLQESEDACLLLGIKRISRVALQTTGLHMYTGFLLGGEMVYENLRPVVPYFLLMPGFKVYMAGLTSVATDENAVRAPVLWRAAVGSSLVSVVNGDYLATHSGIGIFTALLADLRGALCYPVVNAQTMMVQNFPFLSVENDAAVRLNYRQSSEKLFFNALLPDVTAVFNLAQYPLSCFFTSALDPSQALDIKWDSLKLYIRLIVGRSGEMGLSGYARDPESAPSKLLSDLQRMRELAHAYTLTIFSPNGMAESDYLPLLADGQPLESVRTVIAPLRENRDIDVYRYVTDRAMQIPVTMDAYQTDDQTVLAHRSIETALLASNLSVDMAPVLYPASDGDDWVRLNKAWSDNLSAIMYPFRKLDKLSVSEADLRAHAFLNLRYRVEYEPGTVRIHFDRLDGEAYFLLRLAEGKVERVTGADVQELEQGAYLLTIREPNVLATVTQSPGFAFAEEVE